MYSILKYYSPNVTHDFRLWHLHLANTIVCRVYLQDTKVVNENCIMCNGGWIRLYLIYVHIYLVYSLIYKDLCFWKRLLENKEMAFVHVKIINHTCTYTVLHIFTQVLFWAGKQGNHQNFDPSLLSYK
jgi:hypothetical protein